MFPPFPRTGSAPHAPGWWRAVLALGIGAGAALAQTSPPAHPSAHSPAPAPSRPATRPLALDAAQARVVAVPPGVLDTSLFVTLSNPGARPVVLSAARTPLAAHAMLMLTVRDAQGRSSMRAVSSLTVPAHGRLVLDERGPHVMLMGLKRPLRPGEVVTVVLSDSAGQTLNVRATVRKP